MTPAAAAVTADDHDAATASGSARHQGFRRLGGFQRLDGFRRLGVGWQPLPTQREVHVLRKVCRLVACVFLLQCREEGGGAPRRRGRRRRAHDAVGSDVHVPPGFVGGVLAGQGSPVETSPARSVAGPAFLQGRCR